MNSAGAYCRMGIVWRPDQSDTTARDAGPDVPVETSIGRNGWLARGAAADTIGVPSSRTHRSNAMSDIKEAKVPDIGDYDGVPVIEILVAVGDTVKKDQGLVTLESDKATMEVPAPAAGTLRHILVLKGAKVPVGTVLGIIETA